MWNSLPEQLRQPNITFGQFKRLAAVLEDIFGGQSKLTTFFSHRHQNTGQKIPNQPLLTLQKRPMYNCLQVLLHTAAVTID